MKGIVTSPCAQVVLYSSLQTSPRLYKDAVQLLVWDYQIRKGFCVVLNVFHCENAKLRHDVLVRAPVTVMSSALRCSWRFASAVIIQEGRCRRPLAARCSVPDAEVTSPGH